MYCALPVFYVWFGSALAHTSDCPNTQANMPLQTSSSEADVYLEELREVDLTKLSFLQVRNDPKLKADDSSGSGSEGMKEATSAIGSDHKFLLVRPCQRWAGDGLSGLPRHRVTGECCGDGICSSSRWESTETCRLDCHATDKDDSTKALPPTQSALFGELKGIEHDEYHCESMYDQKIVGETEHDCSQWWRNESIWLEDILNRREQGTLPFELPPPGSIAVEFGCGKGQDSRNLAELAGYSVTSIDVSASAIEIALESTPQDMLGTGASQIEFLAYDAFALPAPKQRVDFFFDATVYCGLRHLFLPRDYEVWSRLFTPGHTLVNIQCWAFETDHPNDIARAHRDMEADFEPMFDILHSEACTKNQGGAGWCFYMKLKEKKRLEEIAQDRLKAQRAARNGNMEYLRLVLENRSGDVSDAEYWSLYYIAEANGHGAAWDLGPKTHKQEYLKFAYGQNIDKDVLAEEDKLDGQESVRATLQVAFMKSEWEKAELGEQVFLREEKW